jgi:hypothetical protein
MDHQCFQCGSQCLCVGNLDGLNPSKCTTCGCLEDDWEDDWEDDFAIQNALNCKCGAWSFDKYNSVIHISDCCCGAE